MRKMLEGSHAIALTVKACRPAVISAYPITPQTHIVEDLARMKADGEADFEYLRAESEFAAASIVAGASAAGVRTYTATSSQGLLLMNEVVYNIAGMRLPVVMTLANRGVSAPITIWNDHQDAMSVRDAGWIMLFAENHQEAVAQHVLAFKVAEKLRLPVMVNVDGFILTHSYEAVVVPTIEDIGDYLSECRPQSGTFLDPKKPVTLGAFAAPAHYMEIREGLSRDLTASDEILSEEYEMLRKQMPQIVSKSKGKSIDNAYFEYYGPTGAENVLIAMGSVAGTIKAAIDSASDSRFALLKIKLFRPFPQNALKEVLKKARNIAVLEKAVSLGAPDGALTTDVSRSLNNDTNVRGYVIGLGGRDVSVEMIKKVMLDMKERKLGPTFVGQA